jgi:hypothetical protein
MLGREKLTEAVKLAMCIERGFYVGTVLRDKEKALDTLKSLMSPEELTEYNSRIQ